MMRLAGTLTIVLAVSACAEPYRPMEGEANLEPLGVLGTFPEDGAVDVPVDVMVRITLSRAADPATVNEDTLLLVGPKGRLAATVSVEDADLVLLPEAPLREGDLHRVVALRTIRDAAGVPLSPMGLGVEADFAIEFRTEAVPPRVLAIDPASGAVDVGFDPPHEVVVTFSEPMDERSVGPRCLAVRDELGWVAGTVSCLADDCAAVRFMPLESWREGSRHEVWAQKACTDLSGIPLVETFVSTFTTATDSPEVVWTSPEQGASEVAVDTSIVLLQFSEPLDAATVEPWHVAVSPAVPFRVAYDADAQTVIVRLDATLTSNITYTVVLSSELADVHGNTMGEPFGLSFTTASEPDNNPPGPIVDLRHETSDRRVLALVWTAPGGDTEDGVGKGTAGRYEIRRSKEPMHDAAAFDAAELVPEDPPMPREAGGEERIELEPGLHVAWHYAVGAYDGAGNRSLSDSLPAAVTFEEDRWRPDDSFSAAGRALAIADLDGDGLLDLVVGAPDGDRAYVFPGTASGPNLGAEPVIIQGPEGSAFGAAVAAGVIDGTGGTGIVIGAPLEDGERGAAYLIVLDVQPLESGLIAELHASVIRGTVIRDRMGAAVAIGTLGDLSQSPPPSIIVGAPGDGVANDGAVWLALAGADAAPDLSAAIVRRGGEPGDRFGSALLVGMDLTGDGNGDLVVGAPGASSAGAFSAGRVDVLGSEPGAPRVSLHGPAEGRTFGSALGWGDATGNGLVDLAIGAPYTDVAAPDGDLWVAAGAAYLAAGPVDTESQPLAVWTGTSPGAGVGAALAVTGPMLDGMAGGLALGAPAGLGVGGEPMGTTRLIHLRADGSFVEDGLLEGMTPGEGFGATIVTADLDGDGLADLVVAAPLADAGGRDRGRVHIFR